MDSILNFIRNIWEFLQSGQFPHLGFWDYPLIAVLVAIEGPIVTLLGAAGASAGIMSPLGVFISASIGNLTADVLWYSLGRAGRIEWLVKNAKWFHLNPSHLDRFESVMNDHAPKVLFLAKMTAGFVIPSLMVAGFMKVPLKRWFPFLFAAEMIWTGSLVVVGYYAIVSIAKVERGIEYIGVAATVIFWLFILIFIGRALRKSKTFKEFFTDEEKENEKQD